MWKSTRAPCILGGQNASMSERACLCCVLCVACFVLCARVQSRVRVTAGPRSLKLIGFHAVPTCGARVPPTGYGGDVQ